MPKSILALLMSCAALLPALALAADADPTPAANPPDGTATATATAGADTSTPAPTEDPATQRKEILSKIRDLRKKYDADPDVVQLKNTAQDAHKAYIKALNEKLKADPDFVALMAQLKALNGNRGPKHH